MTAADASSAELSAVIGHIYDCALDPDGWPHALAAISSYIGGNRVRLFLFNVDPVRPDDGSSIGVDRAFNLAFDRDGETVATIKYGFVVAELDKPMTLDEVLGVSGGRDVNGRLPHDNRFWREWMAPRGAHDTLAALAFKTADRFGGLAMTRSAPLPAFGPEEKAKMALITPHVRRALTLSNLIGQHVQAQAQFAQIVDALATPIVILDDAYRIRRINPAAQRLIDAKIIPTRNGMLHGLGTEARGFQGWSTALRDDQGEGLIATALPLGAAAGGAMAVFFHHPGNPAPLPGEAFAKLYGLTGTELRIALLLAEGTRVAAIADRIGCANDTIRWHLKNLRAKLGCARISDVALLAARTASPLLANDPPGPSSTGGQIP